MTNCEFSDCVHYKDGDGDGSCRYCDNNPDCSTRKRYDNYKTKRLSYTDFVQGFYANAEGESLEERYRNAVAMAKLHIQEVEAEQQRRREEHEKAVAEQKRKIEELLKPYIEAYELKKKEAEERYEAELSEWEKKRDEVETRIKACLEEVSPLLPAAKADYENFKLQRKSPAIPYSNKEIERIIASHSLVIGCSGSPNKQLLKRRLMEKNLPDRPRGEQVSSIVKISGEWWNLETKRKTQNGVLGRRKPDDAGF